ncbi:MAG: restriction endonuclease [Elusimicrobiaceae bacterium]|nr:restriction endonuclease [Elusimicrobiaceae bacterium]
MGIFDKKPKRLKPHPAPVIISHDKKSDQVVNTLEEAKVGQTFVIHPPYDELFPVAVDFMLEIGSASISLLQRKMLIGYGRAARIVDQMEEAGLVGPFEGSFPRKVLFTKYDTIIYSKAPIKKEVQNILNHQNEILKDDFYKFGGVEAELLSVDLMEGHEFERWCSGLLLKNGFDKADVTPGSGDQGVDILAEKDGVHYAIQCKCYSHDLGNTPVQEVYAGKEMYRCHVGVVMTNQFFTAGAKQLADQTRVLLWDRDKLKSLINSAV